MLEDILDGADVRVSATGPEAGTASVEARRGLTQERKSRDQQQLRSKMSDSLVTGT